MSLRLQLVLFNFCWFRVQAERRGYVLSATDFNSIAATSVYWIVAVLTSFTHQSNGSLSVATKTCVGSRHDPVRSKSTQETLNLGVIMAESPNQTKRSIWPESQRKGVLVTLAWGLQERNRNRTIYSFIPQISHCKYNRSAIDTECDFW